MIRSRQRFGEMPQKSGRLREITQFFSGSIAAAEGILL